MAQKLVFDSQNAVTAQAFRTVCTLRGKEIAKGRKPLGWKVAITFPPTQARLGLEGPLLGSLMADSEIVGDRFSLRRGGVHLAELEIALKLNADVPPGASLEQAGAAISHLAPAFEMLAVTGSLDRLEPLVASNAYHAGVKFGAWLPYDSNLLDGAASPSLLLDDAPAGTFTPESRVGDPDEIVRFAAEALGASGAGLKAGDCIICGSLNNPLAVEPGTRLHGALGALGQVSLQLE